MIFIKRRSALIIAVLMLTFITFLVCFSSLDKNPIGSAELKKPKIVLDAGHGGIDPGVVGAVSSVKESQINLDIVLKAEKLFSGAGFDVVLTRKTDVGLYGLATKNRKKKDMAKRKEIIENANPDVVVSVHLNEYSLKSRRGGQVFYLKDNLESQTLANFVQKEMNAIYKDVKDYNALTGDLFMLKCTSAPSVIVECGFLSNIEDEKLLLTEEFREEVAYSIFKGVVGYISNK